MAGRSLARYARASPCPGPRHALGNGRPRGERPLRKQRPRRGPYPAEHTLARTGPAARGRRRRAVPIGGLMGADKPGIEAKERASGRTEPPRSCRRSRKRQRRGRRVRLGPNRSPASSPRTWNRPQGRPRAAPRDPRPRRGRQREGTAGAEPVGGRSSSRVRRRTGGGSASKILPSRLLASGNMEVDAGGRVGPRPRRSLEDARDPTPTRHELDPTRCRRTGLRAAGTPASPGAAAPRRGRGAARPGRRSGGRRSGARSAGRRP